MPHFKPNLNLIWKTTEALREIMIKLFPDFFEHIFTFGKTSWCTTKHNMSKIVYFMKYNVFLV